MFFCAWRTSDTVTDCVRDDHKASRTFRKLQGLLTPFSPGTHRSKVQLHKRGKIYPIWVLYPSVMIRPACDVLNKGHTRCALTERAFQEFLTLNSFLKLFVDIFSSFAICTQIVLATVGDIRQDDIFFSASGLGWDIQLNNSWGYF